jgi:hypothetical protein
MMQNLCHYKLNNAKLLGMKIKFEISSTATQQHSDSCHITLKATSHKEMNSLLSPYSATAVLFCTVFIVVFSIKTMARSLSKQGKGPPKKRGEHHIIK